MTHLCLHDSRNRLVALWRVGILIQVLPFLEVGWIKVQECIIGEIGLHVCKEVLSIKVIESNPVPVVGNALYPLNELLLVESGIYSPTPILPAPANHPAVKDS